MSHETPPPPLGNETSLPDVNARVAPPSSEPPTLEQAVADYLAKDEGAAWFRQRVAAERAAATGAGQGPGILKNWKKF